MPDAALRPSVASLIEAVTTGSRMAQELGKVVYILFDFDGDAEDAPLLYRVEMANKNGRLSDEPYLEITPRGDVQPYAFDREPEG